MGEEERAVEPREQTAPARRRRRWPWIVLALVVALTVGGRAALPWMVERGAAYASRVYLGLPIRIDNADFSLLDGVVVLDGVSVAARPDEVAPKDAVLAPPPIDPATALLHWDRVSLQLSWGDLRERTVHLTRLVLESPSVRVEREADGSIDPLRYARPLAEQGTEGESDQNPEAGSQEHPQARPEEASEAQSQERAGEGAQVEGQPPEAEQEQSPPWRFAIDRFELTAPEVVVADHPSGQNLIEFSLQQFALDGVAMQGNDFSLGGIDIQGPVLRVRRDLLLAERAQPAAADAGEPQSEASQTPSGEGPPTGYHIDKIDIEDARFSWITAKGPVNVALALKASDVSMDQGARFPLDLRLHIGKGSITVDGRVGIVPPAYHGKLQWEGLPFPPLLLAALPQFSPWLDSANSSGDLSVDVDVGSGGPSSLRLAGRTSIDTVALADPKQEECFLGWKRFEVVAQQVLVPLSESGTPEGTTRAELESVKLSEPKIRYTSPSPQLDALLGRQPAPEAKPQQTEAESAEASAAAAASVAAQPSAAEAPASAEAAPPPVDLSIASLQIDDGDLEFIDNTITPSVTSHVRGLSVSAASVRFPDRAAASIRLRATLPQDGTLTVEGDLRPGNQGDFTVALQKLDLPVFSPYAAAAGATLDAGQASVKTKVRMRGSAIELDNDLLLRRLGISLHDPGSFQRKFGVPIDLALALLRDPAGNIRLTVPVRVDEKGTSVSLGAIIASALRQAIVGAVTSPLKMLGAVFGGGGEGGLSIEPIPSTPGSAEVAASGHGRVDALVKFLDERPQLALLLRGRTGPEDRPLVAEQILVERHEAGKSLPEVEDAGFLARRRIGQALAKKAKGQKSELSQEDEALYHRYVAAVDVPEARMRALAVARAERVRALLLGAGVAAERARVGEPEAEGTPAVVVGFQTK